MSGTGSSPCSFLWVEDQGCSFHPPALEGNQGPGAPGVMPVARWGEKLGYFSPTVDGGREGLLWGWEGCFQIWGPALTGSGAK